MRKPINRLVQSVVVMLLVGLAGAGSAEDVDVRQELRELRETVDELRRVVERQDKAIQDQQLIIDEMRQQMGSPETAALLAPHIDTHLLHERSGVGEQLGNLRIAIGLTGVVQGSMNAEDAEGKNSDSIDGSWSADLEIESPVGEQGLAFLRVEAGQGEGLTDELSLLYQSINEDATENAGRFEVTEAWYQHYFVPEHLFLAAGKLDMSNYFDTNVVANDELFQFLNSALVNSIAIEFPEDNGPGAVVAAFPADWFEVLAGWAKSDAEWEDLDCDPFGIAEVNFRPLLWARPGNYRFYVWINESDKQRLDSTGSTGQGWGAGISFDQMITDDLIGFLRAGLEDDDVYEVEGAWSIGAELRGTAWNRGDDVLGFAIAQALINDKIEPNDTETLFEAYYSIFVNEQFHLSPDIQIIDNPGGNSRNDALVVLGARAQVDF